MVNVLLTSVGRRTYMVDYFKSALNGRGKVYASNSIMTYSMTHADEVLLTPVIYDENYISVLLEFCIEKNVTAIVSLFDIDLPVLARHRCVFENKGIRLIVSSSEVTDICNDKWKTFLFLKDIGIPHPLSYVTKEDAQKALNEGELSFPVVLKPRWGMGSIGIYFADNFLELEVLYSKLRNTIFKTYLRYESETDKDRCIIIQEKIDGQEYGLDVLNDLKGEYVTVIAKKKVAMRAGETDIAEIVDSKPYKDLARKISTRLRHIANLDVDVFLKPNGDIYVLEMNCRFGGQYPFSHLAGVDFPRQIVEWIQGNDTNMKILTPMIGVRSCKDLVPVKID